MSFADVSEPALGVYMPPLSLPPPMLEVPGTLRLSGGKSVQLYAPNLPYNQNLSGTTLDTLRPNTPDYTGCSQDCVKEIRVFLRGGLAGVSRLKQVWPSLKERYHHNDTSGWVASCRLAFRLSFNPLYPEIAKSMEAVDWDLDRLDLGIIFD